MLTLARIFQESIAKVVDISNREQRPVLVTGLKLGHSKVLLSSVDRGPIRTIGSHYIAVKEDRCVV